MRQIRSFLTITAAAGVFAAAATAGAQTYPTGTDPRDALASGRLDAGVAAKGMSLVSFTTKPAQFDTARGLTFANSDLAFGGDYVYQGNFAGFTIWDVRDAAHPKIVSVIKCTTSQGDPSIYGTLLFISAEGNGNRKDCGSGGVQKPEDHMAGVRIFDVSDPANPRFVMNVETCKGSHTHTIVPHPKKKDVIYLYVSGSQAARPNTELAGCVNGDDPADESNSLFRLDVIRVPLDHPERSTVVTGARIFTGLDAAPRAAGRPARGRPAPTAPGAAPAPPPAPTGPRNCHDVTVYPERHLLAGACGSYGLLVDIRNPEKPVRLSAVADTNFSLWHTAVFSNDGRKVVFTDEWGGGTSPMCQKSSMMEMGGNTTVTISDDRKFTQHAYFKIPSAQTAQENCVSHNGGLIPVPGRDLMAQGWYQGGVNVIDFTDADHPFEVGYFDRGSIDPSPLGADVPVTPAPATPPAGGRARGTIGGSWGAYYFNGYIYSSEIDRGFDVLELKPTDQLSANEIAAARLVRFENYNPQSQPRLVWPAAFPVVRSYLDQLVRNQGLAAARTTAIDQALTAAEAMSGRDRRRALTALAAEVDKDVAGAKDAARVRTMAAEIRRLAAASR
ncbi:MAG: hypothetical protein IPJ78_01180 [Gemmatimonadetes bacterium]|jgi:hypothetical protein|nr:hypothetical protein [Gemmatimonadota bacterium]